MLISLFGALALAVVVALGVWLGDVEEGATGSLGLQPGSARPDQIRDRRALAWPFEGETQGTDASV